MATPIQDLTPAVASYRGLRLPGKIRGDIPCGSRVICLGND